MPNITIDAKNLKKDFSVRSFFRNKESVKAINQVSFSVIKSETLAIVGESGCGKSTLARLLTRLERPTSGNITIDGESIHSMPETQFRRMVQMIFQDPYGSLNPRKQAWQIVAEPLFIHTQKTKNECQRQAEKLLEKVGIPKEYGARFPHMFSGGQRQRLGIARALALMPKILVCDEPVSALDVSIQAQILNLLMDLQRELNLTMVFVSHDLGVVQHVADTVMVLYLGQIMEFGPKKLVFGSPLHPYTKALLASTPTMKNRNFPFPTLKGELPSPRNPPSGCPFQTRCSQVMQKCRIEKPQLVQLEDKRQKACHLS